MGDCAKCGYVRTETKPVKPCQACYLWWQRNYGPPAPCCGRPHYAKGLCLKCWRDVPERAEKRKATERAWNHAHPEKSRLSRRKAIDPTAATGERPFGKCETCTYEGLLDWDHCHASLKFRGWLCPPCNKALGLLQDNIMTLHNLIAYLAKGR